MPTAHLQLRAAKRSDLPALYDLVKELAVYERAPDAVTATLADYYHHFDNQLFDALVADLGGKVVGMALYYSAFSTWRGLMLYLEDFYVQPAFRQYGIGQQLFDAFLAIAKEKKAVLVKWQVLDWNEPALRFYEKNNAIIEKEWWNGKMFVH